MRISLGDVTLWFDVSGPSVVPQGDTAVERWIDNNMKYKQEILSHSCNKRHSRPHNFVRK